MRVIGIDPGVKTGIADLVDGEFEDLFSSDFWGAYEYIDGPWVLPIDLIVVEVATDTYIWQPNARSRVSVAKAMRVAQDVGAVRREGQLLAEGLSEFFTVITKPPPGKLNAERFARLTGYEGRTNQHERDAGLLAWNEHQGLKQRERIIA